MDEYTVLVQWEGLDDAESTWEQVSRISKVTPGAYLQCTIL